MCVIDLLMNVLNVIEKTEICAKTCDTTQYLRGYVNNLKMDF